jgi:hypothetical protein
MEHLQLHGFMGATLTRLNQCRLFLQVMTLVDISSADGQQITYDPWHGKRDDLRPHYYLWPNQQGDPPLADWNLWRRALAIAFCDGRSYQLATLLGSWTDSQSHLWKWFYTPAENRLYKRSNQQWQVYSMEGRRT